jgi:hypothetical protein
MSVEGQTAGRPDGKAQAAATAAAKGRVLLAERQSNGKTQRLQS